MLMDPEATMCLALFGRLPDGARENLDRLTWLLRRIDETRTPNLGDDERALISLITTHVQQTEAGFVSDTFDTLVRPFDKDVQSWTDLERHPELSPLVLKYLDSPAALDNFARMQVAKAAAALGIQPSSSQMEERTQWLAPYLRTPVRLYNEVVKRVIVDGARLTTHNRANWFWDTHILFGIGPDQTAGGRPVLLVTSDSDMVDAAATSDAAELVLPYDAYVNRL